MPQPSELPASVVTLPRLESRRGYCDLPSGIPQGLGVGRAGSCSRSTSISEFLQIINWPRLPLLRRTREGDGELEEGGVPGNQAPGEEPVREIEVPRLRAEDQVRAWG